MTELYWDNIDHVENGADESEIELESVARLCAAKAAPMRCGGRSPSAANRAVSLAERRYGNRNGLYRMPEVEASGGRLGLLFRLEASLGRAFRQKIQALHVCREVPAQFIVLLQSNQQSFKQ